MRKHTPETIRQWLSHEKIEPQTPIARMIHGLINDLGWPSLPPEKQRHELRYEVFDRQFGISVENYQALLAVLIDRKTLSADIFTKEQQETFSRAYLNRRARAWGIDLNLAVTAVTTESLVKLQIKLAKYESLFSMLCQKLRIDADPPDYEGLVHWLSFNKAG